MTAEEHKKLNRKLDELLARTQALDSKLANLERRVDATIEMQNLHFEATGMADFPTETYTDEEIKKAGGIVKAYEARRAENHQMLLEELERRKAPARLKQMQITQGVLGVAVLVLAVGALFRSCADPLRSSRNSPATAPASQSGFPQEPARTPTSSTPDAGGVSPVPAAEAPSSAGSSNTRSETGIPPVRESKDGGVPQE